MFIKRRRRRNTYNLVLNLCSHSSSKPDLGATFDHFIKNSKAGSAALPKIRPSTKTTSLFDPIDYNSFVVHFCRTRDEVREDP